MKVLQLCPRIPYPPVDGGTIGMYNLSTALLDMGIEVKVLAFNTKKHFIPEEKIDRRYAATHKLEWVYLDNSIDPVKALINVFSNRSYNISRFYSHEYAEKLRSILSSTQYDVVQIDYLTMTLYIDDIRAVSDARIILRAHNVEHRIWKRLAAEERNPLKKFYLGILARQLQDYERNVLSRIDALVTLTEEETAIFREMGFKGPVCIAPTCFSIDEPALPVPFRPLTLFHLGAMDWRPNQEGMEWFLENVWPVLRSKWDDVYLYIAGNNMPERFYIYNKDHCRVEGRVPDAGEYMSRYSVMIVPLLAGSGIRVKIVEGMALGKVIISTSQGAEGLHCRNMENIIIADTVDEMANAVEFCRNNPEKAEQIGKNARLLAENYYDMRKVGKDVAEFYNGITEGRYIYK
jgi:glycosyltransferase involved in cell wall biosynthesis